jgi:hypothetical protein
MNETDFLIYALGFIFVGIIAGIPIGDYMAQRRRPRKIVIRGHEPFHITQREAKEISGRLRRANGRMQ